MFIALRRACDAVRPCAIRRSQRFCSFTHGQAIVGNIGKNNLGGFRYLTSGALTSSLLYFLRRGKGCGPQQVKVACSRGTGRSSRARYGHNWRGFLLAAGPPARIRYDARGWDEDFQQRVVRATQIADRR
jgi:hypothetical protein